jgi:hypothetical protein
MWSEVTSRVPDDWSLCAKFLTEISDNKRKPVSAKSPLAMKIVLIGDSTEVLM